MSSAAVPELSPDLVAVACVVEASLLVASQWSRVLIEYVYPLLKRLNELHPSHQFCLAFVTYGAADTRPLPLLSKRFFAPLSLVTRELREEPSKLGIGQTNSGGGRGLSALEGLVAAIEQFDILMASINSPASYAQTQSPQKEGRSLISHILHIAASPPDNVQKPQWNVLQHLDSVSWDTIPAELRKRKINLSLIGLRKIPQFQDLHASVAGPGAQSPWFNVHSSHVLLLAGFPAPQKGTKRQSDVPVSDQSPDAKRQKVAADSASKTASSSPAPPPARIPQTQRSPQQASSQVTQMPPTTSQNPPSAQPVQATVPAPAPAPAPAPSTAPVSTSSSYPLSTSSQSLPAINPELVVTPTGVKFGQMTERLKTLDVEIQAIDLQISNSQSTGQTVMLAELQKNRASRVHLKEQIKSALWKFYHKMVIAKEALNAQPTRPALPGGLTEASSSAQSQLAAPPSVPGEQPAGPVLDDHKPPDSQIIAQFWQSRGGALSAPNGSNPDGSQVQAAARMRELVEKRGFRPQNFGSTSQTSGPTSHETGVHLNTTNGQPIQASNMWNGTFTWTLPKTSQGAIEVKIHVSGIASANNIRTDTWPNDLTLNLCKEPLKDGELSSWLKRHQPRTHPVQFKPDPRASDVVNGHKFLTLHKFMAERHIYACAGWRSPSGKFSYYIFIFPMGASFLGALFPEGLPDLPGGGNALDVPPPVEEAKPRPLNVSNTSAGILARVQSLNPAQRSLYLAQIREHMRRQHLQQAQQPHNISGQVLGSLGMSIPANPHAPGAVANVPAGLQANVIGPGAHNTGGGTVNHEMMQSFMQRSAEGSAPQGGKLG